MTTFDYPTTENQTDFDPSNQTDDNFFTNNNIHTMSENQTSTQPTEDNQTVSNGTPQASQSQAKGKSTTTINDYLKTKRALHARIKKAYLKRIAEDIDKGRKTNVDINRFIFDLIEQGLEGYEKK